MSAGAQVREAAGLCRSRGACTARVPRTASRPVGGDRNVHSPDRAPPDPGPVSETRINDLDDDTEQQKNNALRAGQSLPDQTRGQQRRPLAAPAQTLSTKLSTVVVNRSEFFMNDSRLRSPRGLDRGACAGGSGPLPGAHD